MPENIDASHLTHINYAFAVLDTQFNVVNYEWNDFDLYAQVQAKKVRSQHTALSSLTPSTHSLLFQCRGLGRT
jgi:GH18 family chitinase